MCRDDQFEREAELMAVLDKHGITDENDRPGAEGSYWHADQLADYFDLTIELYGPDVRKAGALIRDLAALGLEHGEPLNVWDDEIGEPTTETRQ